MLDNQNPTRRPIPVLIVVCIAATVGSNCAPGVVQEESVPLRADAQSAKAGIYLFLCGCDDCGNIAEELRGRSPNHLTIYFRGSEGDVAAYEKSHGLVAEIRADLKGDVSQSFGVSACPSLVVKKIDGEFEKIGVGGKLTTGELNVEVDRWQQRD